MDPDFWHASKTGPARTSVPAPLLVEVCWQLQSPTGRVLECGLYETATGIEARMGYAGDHLLYSELKPTRAAARAVAVGLRTAVLQDQKFTEIPGAS